MKRFSLFWNLLTWKLTNHCNEYFMNMIFEDKYESCLRVRENKNLHSSISLQPTHDVCKRNDWWKYLQITAVVYFMKTTARLSQWLARNHVHIYHIFEAYGIHIFFSLYAQKHQLKSLFYIFCSQAIEQISIFLLAFNEINTSIQVKMASFIKTCMNLQSDKKS